MPPAPHVYQPSYVNEGARSQQLGAAAVCAPPIATIITALRQSRAFTADPAYANELLGSLMRKLDPTDTELQRLLSKFGWCVGLGFTDTVKMKELQAALQKYQFIRLSCIGNGAYGSVSRVMNRETRELQAIKQVRMGEQGLSDATLREICTLQELDHCNIIKLRDVIATTPSKYCYLVLELLNTDLYSYMMTRSELQLRTIKSIMYQTLNGLRHAHGHSIMHRDLKPQNILLETAPQPTAAPPGAHPPAPGACGGGGGGGCGEQRLLVKVADFGLARGYLPCTGQQGGTYTDWVVTLFYRAPELLLGSRSYGPPVDVWSAGCVLAELLNRSPLFVASSEIGLLYDMFQKMGTPSTGVWADLQSLANFNADFPQWAPRPVQELVPRLVGDPLGADLLSGLLVYDPRRRLTASQALRHPWFDEVRQEEEEAAAAANAAAAAAAAAAFA